ncbi:uncharacterized protein LOC132882224 isoform X2 [Neoarius graeffei]|uniref:uncharacterized protein LOC132882224 isoform X2 n=1 Tax=Neoarius graeffei TaxID=443677 RepID=UPI00298CEDF7|nr:uncharacterized protein LOC132882224 isoform X2 [Neoarius graeffei]
MFKAEVVSGSVTNEMAQEENVPINDTPDLEDSEDSSSEELDELAKQLEHNLAALLLKIQTILHISESSVQEVIQQLLQICKLSQPLLHDTVKDILKQHTDVDDLTVRQLARAASESNVITRFCGKDGSLSTTKRRAAYVNKNFAVVMPVEYIIDKDKKSSAVYVPLHAMLQKMLNRPDILDKALPVQKHVPHDYSTYRDGSNCKENDLLKGEEFKIAVDSEAHNPLGTSKKKHKMSAVYWVIANVPSKYRSTLHSIQLAVLCKTSDVKEYGYAKILHPLIQDLVSLEQHGVYVEKLGACVKGTVLHVAADNLAAHSLAGFFESFGVDRFCRFCMEKRSKIQVKEMVVHQKMTLRVILTEADIRKVILNTRPATVEDLTSQLKVSLGLTYNFSLQDKDPEFNYELCNLTDIEDLPGKKKKKKTVKVIPVLELVPVLTSDEILSDIPSTAGKWGGHSAEGEPANKIIKKAKKGELNYLPNFPDGFDQAALEAARKDLVIEMQKRTPNGPLVKQKMDLTFALRRKEVVESEPAISNIVERWPALFTEDQVCMEFNRIVGKNLKQEFYESIDRHSPRLIEIFQSKMGTLGTAFTTDKDYRAN